MRPRSATLRGGETGQRLYLLRAFGFVARSRIDHVDRHAREPGEFLHHDRIEARHSSRRAADNGDLLDRRERQPFARLGCP